MDAIILALCLFCQDPPPAPVPLLSVQAGPQIDVYFSPKGGCENAIIEAVGVACVSIHVMAYDFSSKPICNALIAARARGVEVNLIVDPSEYGAPVSQILPAAVGGIAVYVDRAHRRMHNKVMVIDGDLVVTGSFNFSASAEERNVENLLLIRSPEIAVKYLTHFELHREHASRVRPTVPRKYAIDSPVYRQPAVVASSPQNCASN